MRLHQPGRWARYDLFPAEERLPKFAGVYAVHFDDELVYIGSSTNVASRFFDHKFRYGYKKNIVTPWCEVPDSTAIHLKVKRSARIGDWAMWEIRLIKRLKPRFNRQHRGRALA